MQQNIIQKEESKQEDSIVNKKRRRRGERKKEKSVVQSLLTGGDDQYSSSETPSSNLNNEENLNSNQQHEQTFEEFAKSIIQSQENMTKKSKNGQEVEANIWNMNMSSSNDSGDQDYEDNGKEESSNTSEQQDLILATAGSGVYNVVQDQKLSTDESITSSSNTPVATGENANKQQQLYQYQDSIYPPAVASLQQQPSNQANLNEDINMQLYGQISMFDQLTDYNDIDNDDDQQVFNKMSQKMREKLGKGEDEDLYSDNGEEEAGNLYLVRQRIQAINEEIQNFIGMMMGGDDDDQEQNEDFVEMQRTDSPDQVTPPASYIDFASRLHKKRLQNRLKRILKFVNSLDQDLTQKQQQLDQRDYMIAKITREKAILQELLESRQQQEDSWNERDREQKSTIEKLMQENESLKAKLMVDKKSISPSKPLTPRSKVIDIKDVNLKRRNSQTNKGSSTTAILQQSPSNNNIQHYHRSYNLSGSVSYIKQQQKSPKAGEIIGPQALVDKILSLKQHNENELLKQVTSQSSPQPIPRAGQENNNSNSIGSRNIKEEVKYTYNSSSPSISPKKSLPLSPKLNYLRGGSNSKNKDSNNSTPAKNSTPLRQQAFNRFTLQPKKVGPRSNSNMSTSEPK